MTDRDAVERIERRLAGKAHGYVTTTVTDLRALLDMARTPPPASEPMRDALLEIEAFGYQNSGMGYSCARMASKALGKPVK